jgi:hypothetical protein
MTEETKYLTIFTAPVTADQVRAAAHDAHITQIDHHACGICHWMVYHFIENGAVFFAPGCRCGWSPPEPRTWESVAIEINGQTRSGPHGDVAARVALGWGIVLRPLASRS